MGKLIDLTGKTFGDWLVIRKSESIKQAGQYRTMWLCRCVCGREKLVQGSSLRRKVSTSCGRHPITTRPEGHAHRHTIYWKYKENAKAKGLDFDFTEEEFNQRISEECFYCGDAPKERTTKKTLRGNGRCLYNGLDRVDNTKGYTKNNVVPCCKDCNFAKKTMALKDFILMAKKIAQKHGG